MTIIAIKKEKNNKITIGSDSLVSANNTSYTNKLFEINNIIFGGAGYLNELSLLNLFIKNNSKFDKINDEQGILNLFIEFYGYLKESGILDHREGKEKNIFNDYIVILKKEKKAFLYKNWSIREIKDFTAIGSGNSNALPILDETGDVKKAIGYAIKYNIDCGGEIKIKII